MAIIVDIVSQFSDKGLRSARGAFQNFQTSVAQAEGTMGKFKAGATAALDAVKANAATFATGAATALGTFAVKAVTAFQDLALSAGEFSAKTGLAVEDASRWIEVAEDFGIEAGVIEGAIGKMNRTLGSNPGLVRSLGDDIAYANDGTINVNETFLNLIDRLRAIKDPTERAKEAAKLLGRSWQDAAVLIETGADRLSLALAGVSDAKIISTQELTKAREFRDTVDNLKDKAEDLTITVGGDLVDAVDKWQNAWNSGVVQHTTGTTKIFSALLLTGAQYLGLEAKAKISFTNIANDLFDWAVNQDNLNSEILDAADALDDMKESWTELTNEIEGDIAFRDFELTLKNIQEAGAKAFGGTREDLINYQNAVDRGRIELINLSQALDLISQKRVQFLVDTGELERAYDLIAQIKAGLTGPIRATGTTVGIGVFEGSRANGGPVTAGLPYLVGERGPELFVPAQSGGIVPNTAISGGGSNITVNVMSADPNEVVRALQSYNRNVGKLPVSVQ